MGLIEDLGPGPIAIDTQVFVYYIEEVPGLVEVVDPVFTALARGELTAVTSGMTLHEVLVAPYRAGNTGLAARYEAFLTRSAGLRLIEIDRPLLRSAAFLRATTRLKAPAALQIAAALGAGCSAFLTNGRDLPRMGGLNILKLRDYPAPPPAAPPPPAPGS